MTITVDTKCQLKLRILILWTKFSEKGISGKKQKGNNHY